MRMKYIARIGGQALALGGIVSELRRAEATGDKLQLLERAADRNSHRDDRPGGPQPQLSGVSWPMFMLG